MMASVPLGGIVAAGGWNYYRFYVDDLLEKVFVMRTVYTGVPDMYIHMGSLPTFTEYDILANQTGNETVTLTTNNRRSFGGVQGWYYIGIFGTVQGTYLLTVSINRNSFVPLYGGVSFTGVVDQSEVFYFYMEVPVMMSFNMTLSVHPTGGNPDVYMKLCTSALNSTECQFQPDEFDHPDQYSGLKYSNSLQGNEQISFLHTEHQCYNTMCRYVICVRGNHTDPSSFVILGTYDDEAEHLLRDGVSIELSVPKDSYRYFKFQVYDDRVLRVGFHLTNTAGKSKYCLSTKVERPDAGQCEKEAGGNAIYGQLVEFVRGVSSPTLATAYYVSVHSTTQATFSVLAHQQLPDVNSTIALFPGQSQRDLLVNEPGCAFRFYTFEISYTEETKQGIDITLTRIAGVTNMYVANAVGAYNATSNVFEYDWSTESGSERKDRTGSIRISPTDSDYRMAGIYEVLVLVDDWAGASSVSYSILYTSGYGLITLTDNVPMTDFVETGESRFYMYLVSALNETVTITVSETAGDPDLYVSTDQLNMKPTAGHCDAHKSGFGGEALTVTWTDAQIVLCSVSPRPCAIYIAVYGFSQATYSILVQSNTMERVFVEHGPEMRGQLLDSQYAFYYSPLDILKPVKVSLLPTHGNAELFLSVKSDPGDMSVSETSAQYKAEAKISPGVISIAEPAYPVECSTSRCFLDFTVKCDSPMCRFSVLVLQDEDVQLTEGRSYQGYCEKEEMTYFRFYNPKETANIVVTVTAMSSGDPDVYVSRNTRPTTESAQWSATAWRSDVLEITNTQGNMQGEYFMGVYCDMVAAFTITVTTNRKSLVRLGNGRPHYSEILAHSAAYFYYPSFLQSDISISVTPTSGAALVYASTQDDDKEDIYDRLPNSTFHTWSTLISNEQDRISIAKNDSAFCVRCNVVIAVVSQEQPCLFTILARNEEQLTTLQNGVPVRVKMTAASERLFAFELLEHSDLDVSMTVFSGTPMLYMATVPLVSIKSYNWTTAGVNHVEHIHVIKDNPGYRMGWYYILVTSTGFSSISLTAHSRDSYVTLVNGWPQTYSCAYNPMDRLLFQYETRNDTTICKLVPWTKGFRPTVYVRYSDRVEYVEYPPGPGHFDYEFKKYDVFNALVMDLPQSGVGKFSIAVYGTNTDGYLATEMGDFQLYCSSGTRTTLLSLSDVDSGVLDTLNNRKEYELHVPEPGLLVIVLTPCFGSVQLSVSSNATYPSGQPININEKRIEDGRITGEIEASPGSFYITVTGLKDSELAKGVSFQVSTELVVAGVSSTLRMFPGNQGTIEWEQITAKIARLTWTPPETADGDIIKERATVRYRIYATDDPAALLSTACGMDEAESREQAWLVLTEVEEFGNTSLQVELPSGKTVWVNVMAILGLEEDADLVHITYRPVEVLLRSQIVRTYLYKILVAAGGLIFALSIGCIWIYCKYRTHAKANMILTEMAGPTISQGYTPSGRTGRFDTDALSARDTMNMLATDARAS